MAKKWSSVAVSPLTLVRLNFLALAWKRLALEGNPEATADDAGGVSLDAVIARLIDRDEQHRRRWERQRELRRLANAQRDGRPAGHVDDDGPPCPAGEGGRDAEAAG